MAAREFTVTATTYNPSDTAIYFVIYNSDGSVKYDSGSVPGSVTTTILETDTIAITCKPAWSRKIYVDGTYVKYSSNYTHTISVVTGNIKIYTAYDDSDSNYSYYIEMEVAPPPPPPPPLTHETLINGTVYSLAGAKAFGAGTAFNVPSGKFLKDGTVYDISFGAPVDPVFANNDWSTIIAACENGAVPDTWAVGDNKPMSINGTNYQIDIIGKNHDTYTSGGTAPLTFQTHTCEHFLVMDSAYSNTDGWINCDMRITHLPAILTQMPSEVQAGIKEVNKLTSAGSGSSAINTTADKLFLLSEIEIFGKITYSKSGEGSQYAYYSAGNNKVKNRNGSASSWWERSPQSNSSTNYCRVSNSGTANTYAGNTQMGVAFAFCF